MKKSKLIVAVLSLVMMLAVLTVPAYASVVKTNVKAAETTETSDEDAEEATESADSGATKGKALASGIAIGLAALGGGVGMAYAVGKSNEAISRQPEATGSIRTTLMLGLVFIETVVIYALIVTILIIFVM